MGVHLHYVADIDLLDSERAIFNVLKATLEYPVDVSAKSVRLADDIDCFCKAHGESNNVDETLWQVWSVLLEIVSCIPPGHAWQDSLVFSLGHLRDREKSTRGGNEVRDSSQPPSALMLNQQSFHRKTISWKNLPNLSFSVREK